MGHNRELWQRKPKEKYNLEENNIKIDLNEIGWKGVKWVHLVQVE
jgi:hypothetical protein